MRGLGYHAPVGNPWELLGAGAQNKIFFGTLGEENSNHPGTYRFNSTCGISVPDAHILSPDADANGRGEATKPRAGAACVALGTNDGKQLFVCGFQALPQFDDDTDDPPEVGNPDDNAAPGAKVYRTAGGASMILRRGGAVIFEGGAGTSLLLNPSNNQASLRAANLRKSADGYLASQGRLTPGDTAPQTQHSEQFLDQVGASYDRFRVEHGTLSNGSRRRLTLASVTIAGGQESATIVTRESYKNDGSWVGEGPKYQWGGESADEPAVLGQQLVDELSKLIDIINRLQVNTAWGPSTPPLPGIQSELNQLKSSLSGKILSTFLFLSKDPADLG